MKARIVHRPNISFYSDMIFAGKNFKFLRFGDGEFLCHRGMKKSIGKGEHFVFPEITEDIRNIVANMNPKHINGLQSLTLSIDTLVDLVPEYEWFDSDVFHNASQNGRLAPFFRSLRTRKVVVVSRETTRPILKYLGPDAELLVVRDSDSYYDKEMVLERIKEYAPDTVFLFAASRLSVPAIYHSEREDCTMIDVGSLFEPYLGHETRSYHKTMTKEVINRNLGIEPLKRVIYTCITGNYDLPVVHDLPEGWEYYIFTNNKNIGHTHFVKNKELSDVKLARRVKILPWEYFDFDICVWIDGNTTFEKDSLLRLCDDVEKGKYPMVMVQHPCRTCIYQELGAIVGLSKDQRELGYQISHRYHTENIPEHIGMVSSHGIIRANDSAVKRLCKAWWNEVEQYSHRDQVSFNYVKYLNPVEVELIPYATTFRVVNRHIKVV